MRLRIECSLPAPSLVYESLTDVVHDAFIDSAYLSDKSDVRVVTECMNESQSDP